MSSPDHRSGSRSKSVRWHAIARQVPRRFQPAAGMPRPAAPPPDGGSCGCGRRAGARLGPSRRWLTHMLIRSDSNRLRDGAIWRIRKRRRSIPHRLRRRCFPGCSYSGARRTLGRRRLTCRPGSFQGVDLVSGIRSQLRRAAAPDSTLQQAGARHPRRAGAEFAGSRPYMV